MTRQLSDHTSTLTKLLGLYAMVALTSARPARP